MATTMTVSVLFFLGLLVVFLLGAVVGSIGVSYCWWDAPIMNKDWVAFININGTKIYVTSRLTGSQSNTHEYHLSTPWDITTATYIKSLK